MMEVKRYPVYASHVWEILAVINCLGPFMERRQARGESSSLDLWLVGFLERLELLACVMTKGGKDGIVYLRKDDRDLVEKIANYCKVNAVLKEKGVEIHGYTDN